MAVSSAPPPAKLSPAAHASTRFRLSAFAPGWGAAVMGTGSVSLAATALAHAGVLPDASRFAAQAWMWIAYAFGLAVLAVVVARWIRYPKAALADLGHPVKGGMSATIPGALLVLAMVAGRAGADAFGAETARAAVLTLTALGGTLALVFGIVFLTGLFARGTTAWGQLTGAWFIPPVVLVLVPTALSPLLGGAALTAAGTRELLTLSWLALGVGTVLFLVVTAALFVRSAVAAPPPAGLAPTLVIGMGPAGLIGLDLLLLARAEVAAGAPDALLTAATAAGLMSWGFGLWWVLTAVTMIARAYKRLPFALSWWAFTFPLGAWVVAGLQLAAASSSAIVLVASALGAAVLLAVWIVVLIRTAIAIARGTIWE